MKANMKILPLEAGSSEITGIPEEVAAIMPSVVPTAAKPSAKPGPSAAIIEDISLILNTLS
jgi:hypothetical protein